MITIVSSVIISIKPQVDGRSYVTERHAASDGINIDVEYLADSGLNTQAVMQARASNIQAELQAREKVLLESVKFEIPMSATEFMDKLTLSERKAIRNLTKTDENVQDFSDYLAKTRGVYRRSVKLLGALDYLTAVGILTANRKAEIIA